MSGQNLEDLQPVHTIMAGLNAMHLNTTTEQTVTTGSGHQGDAEEPMDARRGSWKGEGQKARFFHENCAIQSKSLAHASTHGPDGALLLNPEDTQLSSYHQMTCNTSPPVREVVTEEDKNVHESLSTQQCPAKPSDGVGAKSTTVSGDRQQEYSHTTVNRAYIVIGDIEEYPGLREQIESGNFELTGREHTLQPSDAMI